MASICTCSEAVTGFRDSGEYPLSTSCVTPYKVYCIGNEPAVVPPGRWGTSCFDGQEARLDLTGSPVAFAASQVLNGVSGFTAVNAVLTNGYCRNLIIMANIIVRARVSCSVGQEARLHVSMTVGGSPIATDIVTSTFGAGPAIQDLLVNFTYCLPHVAPAGTGTYGISVTQDLTAGSGADALTGILAFSGALRYWYHEQEI